MLGSSKERAYRRELNSHYAAMPRISYRYGPELEAKKQHAAPENEQPDFSHSRSYVRPLQTYDDPALRGEGRSSTLRGRDAAHG